MVSSSLLPTAPHHFSPPSHCNRVCNSSCRTLPTSPCLPPPSMAFNHGQEEIAFARDIVLQNSNLVGRMGRTYFYEEWGEWGGTLFIGSEEYGKELFLWGVRSMGRNCFMGRERRMGSEENGQEFFLWGMGRMGRNPLFMGMGRNSFMGMGRNSFSWKWGENQPRQRKENITDIPIFSFDPIARTLMMWIKSDYFCINKWMKQGNTQRMTHVWSHLNIFYAPNLQVSFTIGIYMIIDCG